MSETSQAGSSLDAKFRGEYADLAALNTAVPTPNAGDTAVIIDAAALGYPSESVNVFWNGSGWVVVGRRVIASNNSATAYADPSRATITNASPSGDNIAGTLEFVSSRTVNFRTRQGRVQADVLRAGTYIGRPGWFTVPFGVTTLIQGTIVLYNTMGATLTLVGMQTTVPITATYQYNHVCRSFNPFTTTSAGIFDCVRMVNGADSGGGTANTQFLPAGVNVPSTFRAISTNATQMYPATAGTIFGVALHQTIAASVDVQGAVSVGLRQE